KKRETKIKNKKTIFFKTKTANSISNKNNQNNQRKERINKRIKETKSRLIKVNSGSSKKLKI
ncbi:hypothetical protein, partial [Candidatus Methanomassiliicoccus intestinalis]|uniref:hypothetical protein n=1 Tax=Candidatus Methanomassiliicoccus intestinalis TaxID=1406512 RepID=UPI0037DDCCF0